MDQVVLVRVEPPERVAPHPYNRAMPMATPEEQRSYQLAWITRRRTEWIQANGPCARCGSWDRPEVDHVDPATKTMNPRAIWSRRQEVREAELAKCQVLCHDCHRKKSGREISDMKMRPLVHGTRNGYKRGCHCVPCRQASRDYNRDYRRRKRAGQT